MNAIVTVLKPGLHTTIQDDGRPQVRHLGVPRAGAVDRYSLACANAAIGNPISAAGLEATLLGPTLRFERSLRFAISGAPMPATLNDAAIEYWQPREARAGDILTLGASKIGARTYIAFEGGLSGDSFLGSVSTYEPAHLGGIEGKALQAGAALSSAENKTEAPKEIPRSVIPTLAHDFIVHATAGPDEAMIEPESMISFFSSAFTIGRRAGRMGARLTGMEVSLADIRPMKSSAVFPGTIQAPPDGAPFLLLADAQTLGGYPRIAQVIVADLDLVGQMRPGDRIWFRKTGAEEAREIAQNKLAIVSPLLPGFSYY